MDGADAALVRFSGRQPELLAFRCVPFPDGLRQRLQLTQQTRPSLEEVARLDAALGDFFADVALTLLEHAGLERAGVAAIGSHGQTVLHSPEGREGFTLQIGDPARIAVRTGIATVADFRRADLAAGGQGAPLTPAFHEFLFRERGVGRAVLNIGGIANLSLLPADPGHPVTGFDTGPGNCLLDGWCRRHLQQAFDRDGEWAAGGRVLEGLLQRLLDEPFFRRPPPKSTGRDLFNSGWLEARLEGDEPPRDVAATLTALTARSIAHSLAPFLENGVTELVLCGGGARNRTLCRELQEALPEIRLRDSGEWGIPAEAVEAVAFAWLARERLEGRPANLPAVTGASHRVLLGAVYRP
ncbi:MAG: anhydro-N-acetylmuramic acid kinase [Gammaproteobacteria bacterium]|nr:MAG: anhydro-N-acetylmuramic acid kinase [Gammaproteobacteria bacterium]